MQYQGDYIVWILRQRKHTLLQFCFGSRKKRRLWGEEDLVCAGVRKLLQPGWYALCQFKVQIHRADGRGRVLAVVPIQIRLNAMTIVVAIGSLPLWTIETAFRICADIEQTR